MAYPIFNVSIVVAGNFNARLDQPTPSWTSTLQVVLMEHHCRIVNLSTVPAFAGPAKSSIIDIFAMKPKWNKIKYSEKGQFQAHIPVALTFKVPLKRLVIWKHKPLSRKLEEAFKTHETISVPSTRSMLRSIRVISLISYDFRMLIQPALGNIGRSSVTTATSSVVPRITGNTITGNGATGIGVQSNFQENTCFSE